MYAEPSELWSSGVLFMIQPAAAILVRPQDSNPVGVKIDQSKQCQPRANVVDEGQEASGGEVRETLCLPHHIKY